MNEHKNEKMYLTNTACRNMLVLQCCRIQTADSTHSRTVTKSLSADVTCLQSSLGSKGAELSTCEVLLCYLVIII